MWKIVLLFVLLTPGILLTIPPSKINLFRGVKPVLVTACIHALIFVVLLNLFQVVENFQLGNLKQLPTLKKPVPEPIQAGPVLPKGNWSKMTTTRYSEARNSYDDIVYVTSLREEAQSYLAGFKKEWVEVQNKVDSSNRDITQYNEQLSSAQSRYTSALDSFNQAMQTDLAEQAAAAAAQNQETTFPTKMSKLQQMKMAAPAPVKKGMPVPVPAPVQKYTPTMPMAVPKMPYVPQQPSVTMKAPSKMTQPEDASGNPINTGDSVSCRDIMKSVGTVAGYFEYEDEYILYVLKSDMTKTKVSSSYCLVNSPVEGMW